MIIDTVNGDKKIYYSVDSIANITQQHLYSPEFLNSLLPSGYSMHKLELKKGVPIILKRNLVAGIGLCNGTKLICKSFTNKFIEAEIVNGTKKGQIIFIARITFTESDSDFPFQIIRKQFPVRLAFSMTINKSQGQTLEKVGLYLQFPV